MRGRRFDSPSPQSDYLDFERPRRRCKGLRTFLLPAHHFRREGSGKNPQSHLPLYDYDPYSIREALNNCIAHQDYAMAGRITVQEHEDDYLIFCNCGDFIPGSIENVLKAEYSASNYRNPFLATAMVNLNMTDTVGSGILKMFLAQKKRCFPLPDYDFSNHEVRMKLYGKVLDINYTKRLLTEDLSLSEVFELDRKQKKEAHDTNNDMQMVGMTL